MDEERTSRFGLDMLFAEETVTQLFSPSGDANTRRLLIERSGIDFSGERYAVLMFAEPLFAELYYLSEQQNRDRELSKKMDAAKARIKEIYGRHGRVLFMRRPGSLSILLDLEPEEENDEELLRRQSRELADRLKKDQQLEVKVRVSRIHSGLEELTDCFGEAEDIERYCTLLSLDVPVALYSDYAFSPFPGRMIMPRGMETRLFSCVRSGDYGEAASLLATMTRDSFFPAPVSIYVAESKFGYLKSLMVNLLSDVSMVISVDYLEDIHALRRVMDARSAEEFISVTGEIFAELTGFASSRLKTLPPLWLRDIGKYIDDNYTDPMLNISAIASRFGLSADYISREFKEFRGVSILEYIHSLRLADARRKLAEGMNVHDVAALVGYGHERTMTRAFKKYEGITPGMLRGEGK